jgi:protein CpxP
MTTPQAFKEQDMNTLSKSLLAFVLAIFAGMAVAGHGSHGDRHHAWMAKKLDLTEEQQTQIKAIREEAKEEGKALREEKKALHKEMKTLLSSDEYNASAVEELAARKGELVRKMTIHKAETMHAIGQVMTLEQREKAREIHERKSKKKHGHFRKHKGDME